MADAVSWQPTASLDAGNLALTYIRRKNLSDLAFTIEVSDDLQTWSSGAGFTLQISTTSLDVEREQVVVRDLTPVENAPRRFFRLRIGP